MTVELLKERLEAILGAENVLTEYEDLVCYSFDATMNVDAYIPFAVVLPETTEQIAEIVKIAAEEKIPLYEKMYGGADTMAGGTI